MLFLRSTRLFSLLLHLNHAPLPGHPSLENCVSRSTIQNQIQNHFNGRPSSFVLFCVGFTPMVMQKEKRNATGSGTLHYRNQQSELLNLQAFAIIWVNIRFASRKLTERGGARFVKISIATRSCSRGRLRRERSACSRGFVSAWTNFCLLTRAICFQLITLFCIIIVTPSDQWFYSLRFVLRDATRSRTEGGKCVRNCQMLTGTASSLRYEFQVITAKPNHVSGNFAFQSNVLVLNQW